MLTLLAMPGSQSAAALLPDEPWQSELAEAIEWLDGHIALEDRLALIPPSAQVRGIWQRILERQLDQRGKLEAYRRWVPARPIRTLAFHSVAEFNVLAAIAGAVVATPQTLDDGLYELTYNNAAMFTRSLFGRTLVRLLSPNPRRLSMQAIASRRQTLNYGTWELVDVGEQHVEFYMREEYIWLDSYLRGAAVGTYAMLGQDVQASVDLEGPFHGRMRISWS